MASWISSAITTSFVPAWALWPGLLLLVVLGGLAIHRLAYLFVERRLQASQHTAWLLILRQTKGPTALATIILATAAGLQFVSLNDDLARLLLRLVQLALIALLTWVAIVAVDIFATVYLRRYRLDVEDNFLARKHITQIRILERVAISLITLLGVAAALMSFEQVRQYGVSLFASAGVAGLAVGIAARPLLSNLIAGVQIAMTQPIRIQDVVIVEGEYGTVEEITSTYVVVKLWDWRRMVLPLSYFIEKPFQNWTRESSSLIGSVTLNVDFSAPVDRIREKLLEAARASPLWDGRVANLQVVDANETSIQLRALVSARTASASWDLRCEIREKLVEFLQAEIPNALPRKRQSLTDDPAATPVRLPTPRENSSNLEDKSGGSRGRTTDDTAAPPADAPQAEPPPDRPPLPRVPRSPAGA